MLNDLFSAKPTQKESVYEFIKSKGRVSTHELNAFGNIHFINSIQSRARELKKEGRIWRVKDTVKLVIAPRAKEEYWSVYEGDRGE